LKWADDKIDYIFSGGYLGSKRPAHRAMASRAGSHVTEAPGSHAIYVSNPEVVAAVIKKAAQ